LAGESLPKVNYLWAISLKGENDLPFVLFLANGLLAQYTKQERKRRRMDLDQKE